MNATRYVVVCTEPDGGDVIEGRHAPVVSRHETLEEAIRMKLRWFRQGPNGPVRSADLYIDGVRVGLWDALEMLD